MLTPPQSSTNLLQFLDQGAGYASAAGFLHDGDLVQEKFAPLVRVEDLDRRREPRRSILNVTKHQVMPSIVQEPPHLH